MTSFPRDSQMKTVLEDNQYGEVTVLLRVKVDWKMHAARVYTGQYFNQPQAFLCRRNAFYERKY